MDDDRRDDREQRTWPLVPVKSLMNWKPPEETLAAVARAVVAPQNRLEVFRKLCQTPGVQ